MLTINFLDPQICSMRFSKHNSGIYGLMYTHFLPAQYQRLHTDWQCVFHSECFSCYVAEYHFHLSFSANVLRQWLTNADLARMTSWHRNFFFTLLTHCVEIPHTGPVMWNFDAFFVRSLKSRWTNSQVACDSGGLCAQVKSLYYFTLVVIQYLVCLCRHTTHGLPCPVGVVDSSDQKTMYAGKV